MSEFIARAQIADVPYFEGKGSTRDAALSAAFRKSLPLAKPAIDGDEFTVTFSVRKVPTERQIEKARETLRKAGIISPVVQEVKAAGEGVASTASPDSLPAVNRIALDPEPQQVHSESQAEIDTAALPCPYGCGGGFPTQALLIRHFPHCEYRTKS